MLVIQYLARNVILHVLNELFESYVLLQPTCTAYYFEGNQFADKTMYLSAARLKATFQKAVCVFCKVSSEILALSAVFSAFPDRPGSCTLNKKIGTVWL